MAELGFQQISLSGSRSLTSRQRCGGPHACGVLKTEVPGLWLGNQQMLGLELQQELVGGW